MPAAIGPPAPRRLRLPPCRFWELLPEWRLENWRRSAYLIQGRRRAGKEGDDEELRIWDSWRKGKGGSADACLAQGICRKETEGSADACLAQGNRRKAKKHDDEPCLTQGGNRRSGKKDDDNDNSNEPCLTRGGTCDVVDDDADDKEDFGNSGTDEKNRWRRKRLLLLFVRCSRPQVDEEEENEEEEKDARPTRRGSRIILAPCLCLTLFLVVRPQADRKSPHQSHVMGTKILGRIGSAR